MASKYPEVCKLTNEDIETGCKEFEITNGRFSGRLTASYSEKRRQTARKTLAYKALLYDMRKTARKNIASARNARRPALPDHIL